MRASRSASTKRPRPVDPRRRTAYHEAGHAVLSAAINDRPEHVSIRGHDGTLGRTTQKMLVRPTSLAQVYLAGFAAEHLLTGRRPRGFDIEVDSVFLPTSIATSWRRSRAWMRPTATVPCTRCCGQAFERSRTRSAQRSSGTTGLPGSPSVP